MIGQAGSAWSRQHVGVLVGSPWPGVVADALLDHLLPGLLGLHLHLVAGPLRLGLALQLVGQLLQVLKLQLDLGGVPPQHYSSLTQALDRKSVV